MLRRCQLILGIAALGTVGYAASVASFAQTAERAGMNPRDQASYFVFIYRPGPAWVKGKTVREQPSLAGHIAHMTKLEENGQLVLGGPFKDDSGAMGVIVFEDLEAAEKAVEDDPMVQTKVVTAEVHAWHPAVTGCVAKRSW